MNNGCDIKAIIFDLDGTIIRMTVDFVTMKKRLLERLGKEALPSGLLDPSDSMVDNLARVRAHFQSLGRSDYYSKLEREVNELMAEVEMLNVHKTEAIHGAQEAIEYARRRGLKIGLLTRGSRRYALAALQAAHIGNIFDHAICRDDFPESDAKPNGKALERMAAALGVSPRETLLVGDHLIDLSCARSGGAQFVGVLTGIYDKEKWEKVGCPFVIEDVSLLPSIIEERCPGKPA